MEHIVKSPEIGDRVYFKSNFDVDGKEQCYDAIIHSVKYYQGIGTYILFKHDGIIESGQILKNYGKA